jgi:hypothetical protein
MAVRNVYQLAASSAWNFGHFIILMERPHRQSGCCLCNTGQ